MTHEINLRFNPNFINGALGFTDSNLKIKDITINEYGMFNITLLTEDEAIANSLKIVEPHQSPFEKGIHYWKYHYLPYLNDQIKSNPNGIHYEDTY